MSVTEWTQSDLTVAGPRARTSPWSGRISRLLFSTRRWPWLALDVAVVAVLYEIGLRISPYGIWDSLVSPYWALSVVFAVAFGTFMLGLGSYDRDERFDTLAIVRNVVIATILASLVNLAFHYFALYAVVGRLTLVVGATCAMLGTVALHAALARLVQRRPYRFAVVGDVEAVRDAMQGWARDAHHERLYSVVPWRSIQGGADRPTVERLVAADVAEIVVTADALTEEQAIELALISLQADTPIVDDRTFYSHLFERVPLDDVSKRWILEQGLARPQAVVVATKRLADVVAAGVGLVVLSPFLVLIALAIRLTSPGPVLFTQTRQGRFFRPFHMLKFRTMLVEGASDGSDGFTKVGDDRITSVGRILRRIHFDELPQLVNILRGEMSLVGPRPETLEFARRMDAELPLYELRYVVRPGLTGHAQLKQGYAMDTVLDTQTKLSYDLYYLCNYSVWMDLRLLLRTALFIIRGSR